MSTIASATQSLPQLDYEKLDVYQISLQLIAVSAKIISELPAGYASFADQLRRASLSVTLNIAEAVGRPSLADRKRIYGISRGSAMECGAIIDAFHVLGIANHDLLLQAKQFVIRSVSMLTRLGQ